MLLFSTAVVFSSALLQSFDQVIRQISDDELRHVHFPNSPAINDSNAVNWGAIIDISARPRNRQESRTTSFGITAT
jgi:hypothetical protein